MTYEATALSDRSQSDVERERNGATYGEGTSEIPLKRVKMKVLAEGIQGNPAKKLEKESFSGKQASETPLKTQEIKVLAE